MFDSYFNSFLFITFLWGNVAFVRVQCRSTAGIPDESKSSGQMELCLRRCGVSVETDGRGISNEEMSSRQSCHDKCLHEDGKLSYVVNNRKVLADKQMALSFKRIKRDASNSSESQNSSPDQFDCFAGNSNSTRAMRAHGLRITFYELKDTGRYQGNVSWEPLQNNSVHWTGYRIISAYRIDSLKNATIECHDLDKNIAKHTITNSSYGLMNQSTVEVMVVSVPFTNNLESSFFLSSLYCRIPSKGCYETVLPEDVTTSCPTSEVATNIPTSDNRVTMALVAAFVTPCVFVAAMLLAFVYYRRRKNYSRLANPLTELKFEYDAFIIFSSHDSEWVVKTLIPTLEEKHGLKCCVHYRDFTLGVPIRQNMVDSVYKCRKTVAVVSNNFFNSNYCGSELDYALHRLMEKQDDSLVVIKLDDVDRNKLPRELQTRSYIDYPKLIEKETWEKKLIKCLKVTS